MYARVVGDRISEGVRDLIREYPFKTYQMEFQGVDRAKLADLHWSELCRSFEQNRGKSRSYEVLDREGKVTAFCSVGESAWHSSVLGVRYFRLQPFLYKPDGSEGLEILLKEVLEEPLSGVTEVKIDGSDRVAAGVSAGNGFRQIGISVKLSARSEDLSFSRSGCRGVTVRVAEADDVDQAKSVVKSAHVVSHFYNQPAFPREKVREMFALWFERCFGGIAEKVLVAESDGRVVGFITLMVNRRMKEVVGTPIGVIDFVGVDPSCQGRGIGGLLLDKAHEILRTECRIFEVRTEIDNYPAVRTYQRCGYRITSSDQTWHRTV